MMFDGFCKCHSDITYIFVDTSTLTHLPYIDTCACYYMFNVCICKTSLIDIAMGSISWDAVPLFGVYKLCGVVLGKE